MKKNQLQRKPHEQLGFNITGHVLIKDDLGNVLLDDYNAIHPRNMARIIARALAGEPNSTIYRMAFGNGGTITDAAFQITYRTPNDGRVPDTTGWASRLYNETYSEVVDGTSQSVNQGPGSDPSQTDANNSVVSAKDSIDPSLATITVTCTLGLNEPRGQSLTDNLSPIELTEGSFTFDEIGLFTSGLPPVATAGYHEVDIGAPALSDLSHPTGLQTGVDYKFDIAIDTADVNSPAYQTVTINIPTGTGTGGSITYGDLVEAINAVLVGATCTFNDPTSSINTFGYLKFTSDTTGSTSNVILLDPGTSPYTPGTFLFTELSGFQAFRSFVTGFDAGVEDNPANPASERERLLTHIIFSPILKSANRTIVITYTLTINVSPST